MHHNDAAAFEKIMIEVAECYDKKHPSGAALKLWFESLEDHPFSRIESVLKNWLRTKSKFPAISEVVSICSDVMSDEIEARSRTEKKAFEVGLSRLSTSPTEHGKACYAKIMQMLANPKPPGKWWAEEILLKNSQGEPVTLYALECAQRALPDWSRVPGEDDR